MLRFLFILIFSVFFIGCSNDSSKTEESVRYLSITKAPINSEPVSTRHKITLEFSLPINTATVTSDSVYIKDINDSHVGMSVDFIEDTNNTTVVFTPYQYFEPSKTYTIVVTTAVQSVSYVEGVPGLSLSQDYNSSFSTAADTVDDSNLTFKAFKPAEDLNASPSTEIAIAFSKFISSEPMYTSAQVLSVTTGGSEVNGTIEVFNSILTFKPSVALDPNTTYNVSLVGTIYDMYGNQYSGPTSWSFTTTDALPVNLGYKSLESISVGKQSSIIRTIVTPTGNHLVAVAAQDGVEFFDFEVLPNGYPLLTPKYSFAIPSQINSMEAFGTYYYSYLVLGTMSNGSYALEVNDTNVSLVSNMTSTTPVYGATAGMNIEGMIDRAYSVGPEHGLNVYSVDINGTATLLNSFDMNGSVPLKVASAIDPYTYERRVYVADYNSGLLILDENGTQVSSIDLNGSTKSLSFIVPWDKDPYLNYVHLLAMNALGDGYAIDLNGSLMENGYGNVLSTSTDVSNFPSYENNKTFVYFSDPSSGVIVANWEQFLPKEGIISTGGSTVSTSLVMEANATFLAALDYNGTIDVFNAISDTIDPDYNSTAEYNTTTGDANVTLIFSEYLNPEKIDKSSFSFKYTEDIFSPYVDGNFSFITTDDPRIYILKLEENLSALNIVAVKVTASGNIEDMVGNQYNGGVDKSYEYLVGF